MRPTLAILLCLSTFVLSNLSVPQSDVDLQNAEPPALPSTHDAPLVERVAKGGGGGGKGGGGGGGKGGSTGGSGGKSGSTGGSSGKMSGSSAKTGSSSNLGGSTRSGSGTPRTYGGGAYYLGGARAPYTAGSWSPSGIVPVLLPANRLSFFPYPWRYSVYAYPYPYPYQYTANGKDQAYPVTCLCEEYSVCGCNECGNGTSCAYLSSVLASNSSTDVRIVDANGTRTIYINGTLENGTTAADPSLSGSLSVNQFHLSGYWVVLILAVSVFLTPNH
ncbi:hypothetical protein V8E54_003661 [Elaphomyces granulatus]